MEARRRFRAGANGGVHGVSRLPLRLGGARPVGCAAKEGGGTIVVPPCLAMSEILDE